MRALLLDGDSLLQFDGSDIHLHVNPIVNWFYARQYCVYLIGRKVNEAGIDVELPRSLYFQKTLFHARHGGWLAHLEDRLRFADVDEAFFLKFWDMSLELLDQLRPSLDYCGIKVNILENWDEASWTERDKPYRAGLRGYKPYGAHSWSKRPSSTGVATAGNMTAAEQEAARIAFQRSSMKDTEGGL